MMQDFVSGLVKNNPAWVQLLGLCPLLAVSNSVANAVGLSLASLFVVVGSNVLISALRNHIPEFARLSVFVLVIATFTTITTLFLEAYAYSIYLKIALFVQIIVTNCMILGRVESFASHNTIGRSFWDALGIGVGFALALIVLGAAREWLGSGTLFSELHSLWGGADITIQIHTNPLLPLARYAPGAFIIAGLVLALGQAVFNKKADAEHASISSQAPRRDG